MAHDPAFTPPFVNVAEARELPGLRLVIQLTVPNPWSESAKALTFVKRIPHHRIGRVSRFKNSGDENDQLRDWVGQDSSPIAVWENDPPRDHWARILHLMERIQPDPPLIPADPDDRATMFGLCHEICDEDGFGWNRRLIFLRKSEQDMPDLERKYGAGRSELDPIHDRIAAILGMLGRRLRAQQERGSRYFIGDGLTAADIYWACFSLLVSPPDDDRCALEPSVRAIYTLTDPTVLASLDPLLIEHRDFIYERYLELPIRL